MYLLKRKLTDQLAKYLFTKEYLLITGARQTGKTSVIRFLGDELRKKGYPVYEFTLEDPMLLNSLDQHPKNLFEIVALNNDKKTFVLIDEIQYLKNPTNFLKYLFDLYNEKLKIIATGSSAFYIDTRFKDSLVGRKMLFELHPLDFDEFLIFKNVQPELIEELGYIRNNPGFKSARRNELQYLLDELLTWGGYPALVLSNDLEYKKNLLRELVNTYVRRDVLEANIERPDKFFILMKLLASRTGKLVNVNELSNTIGISVTATNNYLYVLQKCFHIYLVKPFYNNLKKELVKMPKVYFNDVGLRNMLLGQFDKVSDRLDKGELIENYVFNVLRDKYGSDNINYWRTADNHEVDFIWQKEEGLKYAMEVKFDVKEFNANKYKQFESLYPGMPLRLIAYKADKNENDLLAMV